MILVLPQFVGKSFEGVQPPNSPLKLTVRRRFPAGRAGCRVSNLHGVAPLAQAL